MRKVLYTLSLTLLLGMTLPARADIITPAGLNPGDQFRIIFVSSATTTATSANIADYDAFIITLANAAGLTYNGASVTWQALGSTPTVAANSIGRLPVDPSSPALYRLDGVKVADNTSDLWDGSIDAPINVTELGAGGTAITVWTGTNTDGSGADGASLGGAAFQAVQGNSSNADFPWVAGGIGARGIGHRLYGYSEVLTVPGTTVIPEPTSLTLVLVGLGGLAGYRWRRRKPRAA